MSVIFAGTKNPGIPENEFFSESEAKNNAQIGDVIVLTDSSSDTPGFLNALNCINPGTFEDTQYEFIIRPKEKE